jgi:hypothetical protein
MVNCRSEAKAPRELKAHPPDAVSQLSAEG